MSEDMKMDVFEKIKQDIWHDHANQSFAKRGIGPLYKATVQARMIIIGQAPGRIAESTGLL